MIGYFPKCISYFTSKTSFIKKGTFKNIIVDAASVLVDCHNHIAQLKRSIISVIKHQSFKGLLNRARPSSPSIQWQIDLNDVKSRCQNHFQYVYAMQIYEQTVVKAHRLGDWLQLLPI